MVRRLLALLALCAACRSAQPPAEFGVNLQLEPGTVSAERLGLVSAVVLTVRGDDPNPYQTPLTVVDALKQGEVRFHYVPQVHTGTLVFHVDVSGAAGVILASATSVPVDLVDGQAVPAVMTLGDPDSQFCVSDDDCNVAGGDYCDPYMRCSPWDPTKLSGLVLWLNDTTLQGGNPTGAVLTGWNDASGVGNHAVAGPAMQAPVTSAGLNGHRAVNFDGVDDYLLVNDAASLQWGTGPFLLELVARYQNSPAPVDGQDYNYATFYAKQTTDAPFTGPALFGSSNYPFFATPTCPNVSSATTTGIFGQVKSCDYIGTTGSHNDNSWRIYAMRRKTAGTTLEIRVNGAPTVGALYTAGVDVSAPGAPVTLGGPPGIGNIQRLKGEIVEVVAVKAPADDSPDVGRLEAYLRQKYGL